MRRIPILALALALSPVLLAVPSPAQAGEGFLGLGVFTKHDRSPGVTSSPGFQLQLGQVSTGSTGVAFGPCQTLPPLVAMAPAPVTYQLVPQPVAPPPITFQVVPQPQIAAAPPVMMQAAPVMMQAAPTADRYWILRLDSTGTMTVAPVTPR